MKGHENWVNDIAFHPNGNILVSGSFDNTVRLWSTATGSILAILKGHTFHINEVAFSPNGKFIISAARDKTLRAWNVEKIFTAINEYQDGSTQLKKWIEDVEFAYNWTLSGLDIKHNNRQYKPLPAKWPANHPFYLLLEAHK
jgi:WD40 repeat protein